MKLFAWTLLLLAAATLVACGSMGSDLAPSGADNRGTSSSGGGSRSYRDVVLHAADGSDTTVGAELDGGADAVVLYFTMWCPICDSHMSHMQHSVLPEFPQVRFVLVDYVSGSPAGASTAAAEAGFLRGSFLVTADVGGELVRTFSATMGTTIVIGPDGTVRMNEDYKNGALLAATLSAL